MTDAATDVPDVVSSGRDQGRPRVRWLALALLAAVVVALVADQVVADRARTALAAAVADGELQIRASSASLGGLAQYLASPLTRADAPAGARDAAYDALGRDAGRFRPDLQLLRDRVRSIAVSPWDDGLRDARDAYDARLRAWADALAEMERNPPSFGAPRPEVTQTRERARLLLREVGVALPGAGEAGRSASR